MRWCWDNCPHAASEITYDRAKYIIVSKIEQTIWIKYDYFIAYISVFLWYTLLIP